MKRFLLILLILAIVLAKASAVDVFYPDNATWLQLNVTKNDVDNKYNGNMPSRAPIRHPTIGMLGNTLYLYGQFQGLTLQLLDGDAEVYSIAVEPNADEVELPGGMPGVYELRLSDGRFIYSCEIELTD